MLASKSPYSAGLGSNQSTLVPSSSTQSSYPPPRRAATIPTNNQSFASPTGSEFSEGDGPDSVKYWDEDRVCDYLRTVKCGDYEKIFRKNHINGENLLEMDKEVLKEMGIDKVGDRVRLFLGIKKLRTQAYANQKKRNRVSRRLLGRDYHSANSEGLGLFRWLDGPATVHTIFRKLASPSAFCRPITPNSFGEQKVLATVRHSHYSRRREVAVEAHLAPAKHRVQIQQTAKIWTGNRKSRLACWS